MKKLVKESLSEDWHGEFPGDTPADQGMRAAKRDNYADKDEDEVLQQIKDHCENIIQGSEEYFQSLEDQGMDPDDPEGLDSDEIENYASNSAASDLAHQILDIINKT